MRNEIYIITGISGHLGRNIAIKLLNENRRVRGFVLKSDKHLHLDEFPNKQNLDIVYGDVTNKDDIEKMFFGLEESSIYLIHCAGLISIQKKFDERVYNINVNGTKNITDAAVTHRIKKLIYVSSVHAIQEGKKHAPIVEMQHFDTNKVEGCYAKTKAEAAEYVLTATKGRIDACVVHPSGIVGPNDYLLGHINEMIVQYLRGDLKVLVKGGYDMVDVRDVAQGIILACEKGRGGECYILSSSYHSVLSILDEVSKLANKKRIKVVLPKWLVLLFVPIVNLYFKIRHEKPLFTSYALSTLKSNSNFVNQKAKQELGYTTRPFEETIKDTVNWFQNQKEISLQSTKKKRS